MVVSETVLPVSIEQEMKSSYIDYAMSVIVGRALPDVGDGLKPVHRRILYAMWELGITSDKPYKKSARIVGEVLGKYHPHGDAAVYDTIVRMVQDFSMRYPLIDGQGNFGSIDGDAAAAMRYTEVRMAKIAEELLKDIEKETVDFLPNFDGSLREPKILPAKLPNLLINGSSGIAVGMATNIPPHNLGEVVDGIIAVIENPEIDVDELMEIIKAPDFPTGGYILGREGIKRAYETGRGTIKIRAKVDIEKKGKKELIVIKEIPYQVNKSRLIEDIADLIREKKIENIADLRDESDKEGMRIVLELKSGASAEIIINRLYRHTQMETTFGIINLALVDGAPRILTLKEIISCYIDHRRRVVRRRTEYELKKAEKRVHLLEGLMIALGNINEVIKIIKGSKNPEEAKNILIGSFDLTKEQAQEILNMRLQRLTGMEREKIEEEYSDLRKKIARFKEILADERKILEIIKEELKEIKEKYGDRRRTEITEDFPEIEIKDLIPDEGMFVMITHGGYIKRMHEKTFRKQRKSGKGVIGTEKKEEDFVEDLFHASTHDYVLFFTDKGNLHRMKVYEIPMGERQSKGKPITNLLKLEKEEKITAVIPVKKFERGKYLLMATKNGIVKKTELSLFNSKYKSMKAINLDEGDVLVDVRLTDGNKEVVLATKLGKAIRFSEDEVREMGRSARGVRGIKLEEGDKVIGMGVMKEGHYLFTVSEKGYGKRTPFEAYRKTRRSGKGIINFRVTEKNGSVVGIREVSDEDEIALASSEGLVIRLRVKEIPVQGRGTRGVRLMNLKEGDRVVAVARIVL
ncbi:MAG: DNA gyrase subunit A [Candidatus Syntropharchaeia archaeon]